MTDFNRIFLQSSSEIDETNKTIRSICCISAYSFYVINVKLDTHTYRELEKQITPRSQMSHIQDKVLLFLWWRNYFYIRDGSCIEIIDILTHVISDTCNFCDNIGSQYTELTRKNTNLFIYTLKKKLHLLL